MSASHSRPAPHSYRAGSSPMQTILTTQATLKRRAAAALVASALLACTAVVGIEDLPPLANTGDAGDAADGAVSPDAVAPSHPASCVAADYTLTGPCDVFKQDCLNGERCAIVSDTMLVKVSACVPADVNPLAPQATCSSDEKCPPGTVCLSVDGESRCEPVCCDDAQCAQAPGLISGCGLQANNSKTGKTLFRFCDTRPSCTPFGIKQCTNGRACNARPGRDVTLATSFIGFGCVPNSSNPPLQEGASASRLADCADGLQNLGGTCRYLCFINGGNDTPPFDPSLLDMKTAGKGGCPSLRTCRPIVPAPSWLGACVP